MAEITSVPTADAAVTPVALAGPARAHALEVPSGVKPLHLRWRYVIVITGMHVLSLLAFVPWFFSWSGVLWILVGHHLFGMLGITLGYHRLLTHRGFTCPKWFEHLLAILGICCLQDSPARWVAVHRKHHQHSDEQPDPHSPLVTLLWGHMGWLIIRNPEHDQVSFYERYARDLLRDPFYLRLERNFVWLWVYVAHAVVIYALGLAVGWLVTRTWTGALQLGLSWLVWGVFVRTVLVWHGTWAVNSLSHVWGYQNYQSGDNSRNNWLVALMAHGEGWHNNHHADQRAAAHGHRRWEFDLTWLLIRGMERVGFIHDVVRPRCWSKTDQVDS